jgi:transposase
MSNFATDKDKLIQELLQERDELYQENYRLQKIDNGALATLEVKTRQLEAVVAQKDQQIHKLTDQLAWFRHQVFRKFQRKTYCRRSQPEKD